MTYDYDFDLYSNLKADNLLPWLVIFDRLINRLLKIVCYLLVDNNVTTRLKIKDNHKT